MFASTLSVEEFALSERIGVRPVGQVMGASVHQVGRQWLDVAWAPSGTDAILSELDVIAHAWDQARRRAFERMTDEARRLKADVVVGVALRREQDVWAPGTVDYLATGTAMQVDGLAHDRWPVLTDLSGSEYWQLYQAGFAPVGLVASSAVVFVTPSVGTQWRRRLTVRQTQERPELSEALSTAREIALRALSSQADANHAEGIVGVRLDRHVHRESFPLSGYQDQEVAGLVIAFHAVGTAIARTDDVPSFPPQTTVDLQTKRNAR